MKLFDLTGKVAFVTGATKGIGRGIVERLAEHGARVAISSRDQRACDDVAAELNATYGKGAIIARGFAADLSDLASLEAAVGRSIAAFGRIDSLVCNAAVLPFIGPSAETPKDLFERILLVNVHNNFRLCQMVIPGMKERRDGSIILIGSTAGLVAMPHLMAYALAKAAEGHLARTLAAEVAAYGIRVNCVAPGLVRTHSSQPIWQDEAMLRASVAQIPLQRIGEPDDIAGLVVCLSSAAGSYVTGATIPVDGGTANLPAASKADTLQSVYSKDHRFN